MLCKHGWLLVSFGTLFLTAPALHAQTLSVVCTNPAGPTFAQQPSGPIFLYGTTCVAGGGVAPYSWSIVNGQLPAGLTAQNDSQYGSGAMGISGQPTTPGPYNYTVQFTDSQNQTAGQSFSGTVAASGCIPGNGPTFLGNNYVSYGPSGAGQVLMSFGFAACPWALSSDVAGVTFAPSSGTTSPQNPVISVNIPPNSDPFVHHGNFIARVNGSIQSVLPFTENSTSCSYAVSPSSIHLGAAGGAGIVTIISTPSDCAPFPTISDTWFGFGISLAPSGGWQYQASENSGGARTMTVQLGAGFGSATYPPSATLTATQDAASTGGPFQMSCAMTGVPTVAAAFPAVCWASGGMGYYSWSGYGAPVIVTSISNFVNVNIDLGFGHYHFTVKATDGTLPVPNVQTYTFDGDVLPSLHIACTRTAGSQTGSGYGVGCTPSGGTPPYHWSINSGTLPSGVTLSDAAGGGAVISGTPTVSGDYFFTVQVTDSGAPTPSIAASKVIAGTIVSGGSVPQPLAVACTINGSPSFLLGQPLLANLCAGGGGTPPYHWAVHSGSLPPALALSTDTGNSMMLSGTPTSIQSDAFFLKLTDSSANPQSIIWAYNISIYGQLTVNCQPTDDPIVGQPYIRSCGASAGGGPANPWISAGTLPAGLIISNGVIQGTPTTPGPYSYTVSVGGSLSPTAPTGSQTFTGVVTPLPAPLAPANVSGSMAHLAIGDGWSTATVLMNTGANYAQAHVGYFGDGGTPLPFPLTTFAGGTVTTASAADQIMAAHSMFEVDSAAQPGDPLREGSANVSTDGDVNGFIRFRYAPRDQDATVPLETRKAGAYLLPFDNTSGIATGVAIANLSANTASVPVVMRDDTGAQIGSASFPLPGKGHSAFVLSDQFPNLANRSGTVEFDTPSGGRISVLGLRFPPGQQFTTIPVIASSDAGGGSLAHLAVGNGWTSTVELVNVGASAAQAHLKFFGDDGNPLLLPLAFSATTATTSTVDQAMAPHSRFVIQSTALDSDALQIGSAQLTTDGSVSGFIRFRYGPRNQEAIVPMESRNSSSYIVAFDNTNGLAAGVAVANLSAGAVTIPVLIRDSTGAQLGSGVVTLAANGHSAFVLSDQFIAAANQTGTVEFDVPAGSQITVLGLRFPASGAFSTIPVVTP